jgi:clan AA aspartic protease
MAKMRLSNWDDQVLVREGIKAPGEVRALEVEGLVDTGTTMLVLPGEIVRDLGLKQVDQRSVRYADGRSDVKRIVGNVRVEIMGRSGRFDAVEEPASKVPLIGQVILEELDFIVNPGSQDLKPDPDSPDMPTVDIL